MSPADPMHELPGLVGSLALNFLGTAMPFVVAAVVCGLVLLMVVRYGSTNA